MARAKIKEQLGKSTKAKIDPTSRLMSKIHKKLWKHRKKKFTNKTYFELCPSDTIPARLYGTIKAHKPEKKLFYASHCLSNRYATLWNIKISCRYHSAHTQQKPTPSTISRSFLFKRKRRKLNQMKCKFHMMSQSFTYQYPSTN